MFDEMGNANDYRFSLCLTESKDTPRNYGEHLTMLHPEAQYHQASKR
jgi:hypothetical protein